MTYWTGKTKDGREVNENNSSWTDVKDELSELGFVIEDVKVPKMGLVIGGQRIDLPKNMPEYIQAKTASADMNGNNVQIESRYIGFCKDGTQIILRVNEESNDITVELQSIP